MLTTALYPYQDEACDMVLDLGYGLIAYEMGLGKTIVAIAIVEELLSKPDINFALIVVPSTLKYQWAQSIAQFTDVETTMKKVKREQITIPTDDWCVVVNGTPTERRRQYETIAQKWPNYVIVSYEQVVNDWTTIRDLEPECVILDEATAIKGFKSLRARRIKTLGRRAEVTVALTGTPMENRPEETYSIMQFVEPQILGSPESFDRKYIVRNDYGGVERYRNLDLLNKRLSKVMSRKTRHDPDVAPYMPSVTYKEEYVFLPKATQSLYNRIARETVEELSNATGNSFDLAAYYNGTDNQDMTTQGRIQARHLAMQMLCCHPDLLKHSARLYLDGQGGSKYAAMLYESGALEDLGKPVKLLAVKEDVERILEQHPDNKVIIFSFFKEMGRILQDAFDYDSVIYNGDMTTTAKEAAKTRFQSNPDCRLFIATDAGAYGVDLPQANYLINYDLVDSAGKMDQRGSRHVRAGSKHDNVFVINYLVDGSIEERRYARLLFKRRVAGAVIDGAGPEDGTIENDVEGLSEFLEYNLDGEAS